MSQISTRAQKILTWLQQYPHPDPLPEGEGIPIRQQTLAELFGCSRRSIGRALKELKEAGLLVDLNKRHKNRCKIYQVTPPLQLLERGQGGEVLTPEATWQWQLYEKTFRIVFKMPNLEQLYAQVTWDLEGVKEEKELWTKTFAGLWAITGSSIPTEKVFDPKLNSWFYRRKEL